MEMDMRGRAIVVVALAGLAVAGGAVAATPAYAVGGIQIVSASSATDSMSTKSATATCPAGTVIYGGGGYLVGATGHSARLNGLRPLVTLLGITGFRASATEDDNGLAGNWSVDVYAICGPTLPGWQVIWSTSPSSSQSWRSATATCPAGKKVISAGAEVANGGGNVVLQLIVPDNGLGHITTNAYEDENGYNSSWQLTAYAVCANPLTGLQLVVGGETPEGSHVAVAECPAGYELLGMGGYAVGGAASLGQLYLIALYGANASPWEAVAIGLDDETGFATAWTMGAYAICAY
jgi:hypothetical protein